MTIKLVIGPSIALCTFPEALHSGKQGSVDFCYLDRTTIFVRYRKVGPVKRFKHNSCMAVVTQTDRSKSDHNRCVIEFLDGDYGFCFDCVTIIYFVSISIRLLLAQGLSSKNSVRSR